MSAELLANVSMLRGFPLFREKPDLCSHLFNTDKIELLLNVYPLGDFLCLHVSVCLLFIILYLFNVFSFLYLVYDSVINK